MRGITKCDRSQYPVYFVVIILYVWVSCYNTISGNSPSSPVHHCKEVFPNNFTKSTPTRICDHFQKSNESNASIFYQLSLRHLENARILQPSKKGTSGSINKAGLIFFQYGKNISPSFPWYLETASRNPVVDFLIFHDDPNITREFMSLGSNIFFHYLPLEKVKEKFEMVTRKKLPEHVDTYVFLCNIRPLLGIMYEDILRSYPFWGWGDTDVMYTSSFSQRYTLKKISNYDLVALGWNECSSGPLTFVRNSDKMKKLGIEFISDIMTGMNENTEGYDELFMNEKKAISNGVRFGALHGEIYYRFVSASQSGFGLAFNTDPSITTDGFTHVHVGGGKNSQIRFTKKRLLSRKLSGMCNLGCAHCFPANGVIEL